MQKSRKKTIARILFYGLSGLLLLLIGLALIVFYTPFSSHLLDQEIREAWRRATGLEIAFERVTYRLSEGRMELRGIRIEDPEDAELEGEVERMRMRWGYRPLQPSTPLHLEEIAIDSPTPLSVLLDSHNRLSPESQTNFYLELFHRLTRERRTAALPASQRPDLVLDNFTLDLRKQMETGERPRLVSLEGLRFELRQRGRERWTMAGEAQLAGSRRRPPLEFRIYPSRGGERFEFYLGLEAFELSDQSELRLPLEIESRRIAASGAFHRSLDSGAMRLNLELETDYLDLLFARADGRLLDPAPTDFHLSMDLLPDAGAGGLAVEQMLLGFQDSSLEARGTLRTTGDWPFEAQLVGGRLETEGLRWMAGALEQEAKGAAIRRGSLEPRLQLQGDRQGLEWENLRGSLQVDGLELEFPELADPLGPLSVDCELSSESLSFSALEMLCGDSSLRGNGRVDRQANEQGLRAARASWTADLRLADLEAFAPTEYRERVQALELGGSALGNGTLRGNLPSTITLGGLEGLTRGAPARRRTLQELELFLKDFDLAGLLRLDDIHFDHPSLPAPLEGLSGGLVLSRDSLECNSLEGRMLDSRVVLSGRLRGKDFFWHETEVAMDLVGDLDLTRKTDLRPGAGLQGLRALLPRGDLRFDLNVRGPLARPAQFRFRGDLVGENLALQMQPPLSSQTLEDFNFKLHLLPERILLSQLEARVGEQQLATSGTLGNAAADLELRLSGDFLQLREAFPWLVPRLYEMEGPFRLNAELDLAMRPEATLPLSRQGDPLAQILALVMRGRLDELFQNASPEKLRENLNWQIQGRLEALGCTFEHVFMPRPVSRIEGVFLFDEEKLWTSRPAQAQWGSSMGTTSGTVRLMPRGYPYARFEAVFPELNLDEWITRWGPPSDFPHQLPPVPDYQLEDFEEEKLPEYLPMFQSSGIIRARTLQYKKFRGEDFEARMEYVWNVGKPGRLLFDPIRGRMYDGQVDLRTRLILLGKSFAWNFGAELDKVQYQNFAEAFFGQPSTISGRLGGHLLLQGNSRNPEALVGAGEITLNDSVFLQNPLFMEVGKLLSSDQLRRVAFTDMHGRFELRGETIEIPEFALSGAMLELEARGQADLQGNLDMRVYYRFLDSLTNIPVLSGIKGVIDYLGGKVLTVRLTGNIKDPKATPVVPLSEELQKLRFRGVEQEGLPSPELRPPEEKTGDSETGSDKTLDGRNGEDALTP